MIRELFIDMFKEKIKNIDLNERLEYAMLETPKRVLKERADDSIDILCDPCASPH